MGVRTDMVLGGRYRLGDMLGRGGMADVYEAVDERLDRRVAVKVLRGAMAARADVRRRFEAEARAAASLSHPNVVAVFDTGEDTTEMGNVSWIVMERLPGETLADRMSAGLLDPDWVARVAGDVLGALAAAHDAGIIHRDIKPGNILIGDDGCAKVADFGIAKSIELADDTTHTGALIGTPAYLAPERIDGEPATAQSDIYGLGVVLYEALAGEKPFRGTTPVSVAYAVHHSRVRPLAEVRPELPAHLSAAVHTAMDRDPARRFPTARDMGAALRSGVSGVEHDATVLTAPADSTLIIDAPLASSGGAAVPVAGEAARQHRASHPRGTRVLVAVVVMILLGLVVLGMSLTNDADPAGASVADRLRDAAGELQSSDGPNADDAAARLQRIADLLDADAAAVGGETNALLTDLAIWQASGDMQSGAVARLKALLMEVPGADGASFAVPTTAPPTTVASGGTNDGAPRAKGKGKAKGNGDDD